MERRYGFRFGWVNGRVLAMALAGVFACGACGDAAGGGSGGSGGGAGGSGAGGAGGNGAGGIGGEGGGGGAGASCTMDQEALLLGSWPWLGFEDSTPDLFNGGAAATVMVVDAFGMDLAFDAGGMPARFAWEGADLGQVFGVGDPVMAMQDNQNYLITSAKGQAVAMRYANAEIPTMLPAIPGGGPNLEITQECVYEQVKDCPMPERRTLYSITALLGDDGGSIPSGVTMQIGAWQIHHVKTTFAEYHNGMECISERFFDGMLQALEVKP